MYCLTVPTPSKQLNNLPFLENNPQKTVCNVDCSVERNGWCKGRVQCIAEYSTVQYSTVQYSTVQYSTVQYSTVQYCRENWLVWG